MVFYQKTIQKQQNLVSVSCLHYTNILSCLELTPRLEQLVQPKQLHKDYIGDHPSPIWKINPEALSVSCTPRLSALATPKSLHADYQPSRQVHTYTNYSIAFYYTLVQICPPISRRALSATPSRRLIYLARPKIYLPLYIKPHSEWDWGEWTSDIKTAALQATPSERITELSQPKTPPPTYQPCRQVQWPISPASLQHVPNDRLVKLACPKQIPGYQEDYDPHAWSVSKAALLAQTSPGIDNLAKPLPRKCRQKKG